MDLTPLDIRKKKDDFKRAMRGYDVEQVESFLEACAERLDELVQRNSGRDELLADLRLRLEAYEGRERALNDALVTAQELREEARAQADRSSRLKVRAAEQEAEDILRSAEAATETSRRSLDALRIRRAGFLRSMRWSLERFLGEIEEEERRTATDEAGDDGRDAAGA
jgi:DivIVA domain-containing protein